MWKYILEEERVCRLCAILILSFTCMRTWMCMCTYICAGSTLNGQMYYTDLLHGQTPTHTRTHPRVYTYKTQIKRTQSTVQSKAHTHSTLQVNDRKLCARPGESVVQPSFINIIFITATALSCALSFLCVCVYVYLSVAFLASRYL